MCYFGCHLSPASFRLRNHTASKTFQGTKHTREFRQVWFFEMFKEQNSADQHLVPMIVSFKGMRYAYSSGSSKIRLRPFPLLVTDCLDQGCGDTILPQIYRASTGQVLKASKCFNEPSLCINPVR